MARMGCAFATQRFHPRILDLDLASEEVEFVVNMEPSMGFVTLNLSVDGAFGFRDSAGGGRPPHGQPVRGSRGV